MILARFPPVRKKGEKNISVFETNLSRASVSIQENIYRHNSYFLEEN